MSKTNFQKYLLIAVSASILGLSGCKTTSFSDVETDRAAIESRLPDQWQLTLQQGQIPQDWQSLFNDPILTEYMQKAETQNSDINRAIIRVRQAEAGLRQTRSVLLPVLRADAQVSGVSFLNDIELSDSYSDGLSASWDPGLFGRNAIEIDGAESLLNAQRANAERVRRIVMAQVARTYIQIIETDYQLILARENLDFIGETLRISEARFEAGDIARDQLALAQLETANAKASVETLELSARNLRRNLAVLIGDNPDSTLPVAEQLPNPADLSTDMVPMEVLGRRFDVGASRARIVVAFSGLQQAERLNWPSLALTGRLSGSGSDLGDLFDIDGYISSLASSLTATLFDGGRKDAQIETARAGLDEALINYDEVLRNALLEVESGFDRMAAARRSLKILDQGSEAANKALELEKIKYDLGESIILDVLTVQRRVNAILASNISTQRRLLDAQIDTYLALGGEPIIQ